MGVYYNRSLYCSQAEDEINKQWNSQQGVCIHQGIYEYAQLLGEYFDKRIVNFHNTVLRAEGVSDTFLRYEYGTHNGRMHCHAIGLSTSVSMMVNEARSRALNDTENTFANGQQGTKNYDTIFREYLAKHIYEALHTVSYDGIGSSTSDPGYSSLHWQSRHASSKFSTKSNVWLPDFKNWTAPEGKAQPLRGKLNPCAQNFFEVTKDEESFRAHCIGMDNSCYEHKCTPYCSKKVSIHLCLPETNTISTENDKVCYKCRFGMAKLDKNRKIVSHRQPHNKPKFVKRNGHWRFEAPVDNWRVLPKPKAHVVWGANEVLELVIAAEPVVDAHNLILVLSDYVADYTTKSSDSIELARRLFRTLVQAANVQGCQKPAHVRCVQTSEDATRQPSSPSSTNPVDASPSLPTCTLGSLLHSIMQRLAGLPILTHLQAVMLLSGVPAHRSTRQIKALSLNQNRLISNRKSQPTTSSLETDIEPPASDTTSTSLQKYFNFRDAMSQSAYDQPSLYQWLKRVSTNHVPPVVMPTGTHQLNFTWPIDESWARAMLLLFSKNSWTTDADCRGQHATFHDALLDLCGLKENGTSLHLHDASGNVPKGLIQMIQSCHALSVSAPKKRKHDQLLISQKISGCGKTFITEAVEPHFGPNMLMDDKENDAFISQEANMKKARFQDVSFLTATSDTIEDTNTVESYHLDHITFEPPPPNYDFHAAGREQLKKALQTLHVPLESLTPSLPAIGENETFEQDLAKTLLMMSAKTANTPSTSLPEVPLLRTSMEQRAAIVCLLLPVIQRRQGLVVPPTRLKILGEAGSGKTVVMLAHERLVKRLSKIQPPEKVVLGVAPTGAVA
ncbi:MAG: hypothetical protein ACO3YZ_06140, partial [Candidatus Nanopelagicaceae bacterium]